jgi:hypothetical protein
VDFCCSLPLEGLLYKEIQLQLSAQNQEGELNMFESLHLLAHAMIPTKGPHSAIRGKNCQVVDGSGAADYGS